MPTVLSTASDWYCCILNLNFILIRVFSIYNMQTNCKRIANEKKHTIICISAFYALSSAFAYFLFLFSGAVIIRSFPSCTNSLNNLDTSIRLESGKFKCPLTTLLVISPNSSTYSRISFFIRLLSFLHFFKDIAGSPFANSKTLSEFSSRNRRIRLDY